MGYTHYYAYDPNADEFKKQWPHMVEATEKIIEHAGIPLADAMGTVGSRPELGLQSILLNGVGPDSHETLAIALEGDPRPPGQKHTWAFCKTARKPYDLVVAAVLLRCAQLAPDSFVVDSDGAWNDENEWGPPRKLVGDLFGTDECPDTSGLANPDAPSSTEGPPSVRAAA